MGVRGRKKEKKENGNNILRSAPMYPNMSTAKQKERQEGRERYGSGHRLIRESMRVYVYMRQTVGKRICKF